MAARGAVGLDDFVGVTLVAVDVLGGWTELGVVGEVELADSDGTSWVDGVSDRAGGWCKADDLTAGETLGVDAAMLDVPVSGVATSICDPVSM
jgi:hypothetical protein